MDDDTLHQFVNESAQTVQIPATIDLEDPLDVASLGDPDRLRDLLRKKCRESIYFLAKAVLRYDKLYEPLHGPLCHWIRDTERVRRRGILMPRASYKSTLMKAYLLHRIVRNRNVRILVVGESDGVAQKALIDVKWHMLNNPLFRWLFPECVPADTGKTTWTQSEILIPRDVTFDEPTIMTAGVGAKLTGFHFNLIIYDDMIGEKAAFSPAEMQSAVEWFELAPGLLDDPSVGEEILVGTRWRDGVADIYGYVMDRLPFKRLQRRYSGFVWYIRSAIENNESILPTQLPLETLEEIRKREGEYKFNAQYMNRPTAPGSVDFPPEWIRTYKVDERDHSTILPTDGTPSTRLPLLVRISMYDPSAGGVNAGAENAIIVVGADWMKRIFVLDAFSKNCGFGEAIEWWHRINDHFKCWRNYYEQVGAQKAIEDFIPLRRTQLTCKVVLRGEKECGKAHRRLDPVPVKPFGGNRSGLKEDRIRSLAQPAFEEGRVYLRLGQEKLRKQITSFPHSAMVDLFDALAYAISLVRYPLPPSVVEEEALREKNKRAVIAPRIQTAVDYGGYS